MRSRPSIGLLIGLVLLAISCGGQSDAPLSKEEYEREVLSLVEGPGNEASVLYTAIVIGLIPADECTSKTARFHEVLEGIVDEVEQLRPPSDVAELQAKFLVAAHESLAEVGRAAADVENGKLSCGIDLNRRIYGLPSTDRAERVLSEVHELGYLPFLFGD
jgi:hypothetical protein